MWDLFSQIRRVAPHYRSLLVTGEPGRERIWSRRRFIAGARPTRGAMRC